MSDFAASNGLTANTEQLHINEAELEQELAGPIHYTTKCKLVCAICVVNGTLSITTNELYFEVDETDQAYKSLDSNLLSYADNFHGKWHFNEIRSIFSRRYLLQNVGLEIFVSNRNSVMFAFQDRRTVEKVSFFFKFQQINKKIKIVKTWSLFVYLIYMFLVDTNVIYSNH